MNWSLGITLQRGRLLLHDVASLTIVRRYVHQAEIHKLLQDLELRLIELKGIASLCLTRSDFEGDIILRLAIAAIPHHLIAGDVAAARARDRQP